MIVVEESSFVSFPRSIYEHGRANYLFSIGIDLYMYVAIQYIMLEARDNPVNQSAGSFFFLLECMNERRSWLRICCSLTFSLFPFDSHLYHRFINYVL